MAIMGCFIRDEGGFTAAGSAVALLLACSLVFASVQMYRVQSAAGQVQHVADAAAMAAENEVASFVVAVRVCDACLLTMTMSGLTLLAVGTACLCAPPAAEMGRQCIDAGRKILEARDAAADKMVSALNAAQDALPAAAAAQGMSVIALNSSDSGSYAGYVELAPMSAPEVALSGAASVSEAADEVEGQADGLEEAAARAQEEMDRAQEALTEAYMHDCGNAPGYCMQERAAALSGISPEDNPLYHSPSTWSFSVALSRAQEYYPCRIMEEEPVDGSVEEQVRSTLRLHFYEYAYESVMEGYVIEDEHGVADMYFPDLPSNTESMKQTRLYTDRIYPVSQEAEGKVIHAYARCPGNSGDVSGLGSLADLDAGVYGECSVCKLTSEAMGSVAAASTSIDNGFEYHYRKVAQAAARYLEARSAAQPHLDAAREMAQGIFDGLREWMEMAASCRIEAHPPGRFGAVAAVAADHGAAAGDLPFVQAMDAGEGAAISASVLVDDGTENVVENLADGALSALGIEGALSGHSVIGQVWKAMLDFYKGGVQGVDSALRDAVGSLPLAGVLGPWAADALQDLLDGAGLQPANTASPETVLLNTSHVAGRSDDPLAVAIREVKNAFESG